MVTFIKMPHRWEDGTYDLGFAGLSTDDKPTEEYEGMEIANGSSFFEIDELKIAFYDKSANKWIYPPNQTAGSSTGTTTATNIEATASVDATSGTPTVTVTKSTDDGKVKFDFAFTGLKGADGASASGTETVAATKSLRVGDGNTDGNNFNFEAGGGNTVSGMSAAAIGTGNSVKGGDCMAIGNHNKVNGTSCIGVGYNLPEIHDSPFPFMVGNGRLGFAVVGMKGLYSPTSSSQDTNGGVVIQGTNGSSIAYYRLTISNGNLSITDVTSQINFV